MIDPGVLTRLPHGPRALMISEVSAHAEGTLTTVMRWNDEDLRIVDHFALGPRVVPGVFLAEQAAQSALLLALLEGFVAFGEVYTLGTLRYDFVRPAVSPCETEVLVSLTARVRGFVGFQAECRLGGETIARIKGVASPARSAE